MLQRQPNKKKKFIPFKLEWSPNLVQWRQNHWHTENKLCSQSIVSYTSKYPKAWNMARQSSPIKTQLLLEQWIYFRKLVIFMLGYDVQIPRTLFSSLLQSSQSKLPGPITPKRNAITESSWVTSLSPIYCFDCAHLWWNGQKSLPILQLTSSLLLKAWLLQRRYQNLHFPVQVTQFAL